MPSYKFTGPWPECLASGRPLAFGDVVDLGPEDEDANARLIDAGQLVPLPGAAPSAPRPRKPQTRGEKTK